MRHRHATRRSIPTSKPRSRPTTRSSGPRSGAVRRRSAPAIPVQPADALDHTADEQARILEERWGLGGFALSSAFSDTLLDPDANEVVADFVRGKIRAIVTDPDTAELLCPDQTFACKRPCVDSGYYETFNRDERLAGRACATTRSSGSRTTGLELADGSSFEFDTIVFATGYDAMTGSLLQDRHPRAGAGYGSSTYGRPVRRTLLGLGVPGFPNLFTVTGPGSPSVLANMITAVEQHVDWIADCVAWMRGRGPATIEADDDAADDWVAHVNDLADAHPLSHLQLLVPRCERAGQAAGVHARARMAPVRSRGATRWPPPATAASPSVDSLAPGVATPRIRRRTPQRIATT